MIVGERVRISGTVEAEEDLVVRGRVEGVVRIAGALTVEEGGFVQAEVQARRATVLGVMRGTIRALERIEVARTGRMVGDAIAVEVNIAAGAGFRGRVEMGDPQSQPRHEAPAERVPPTAAPSTSTSTAPAPTPAPEPAAKTSISSTTTPISSTATPASPTVARAPSPGLPVPTRTRAATAAVPAPPANPLPNGTAATATAPRAIPPLARPSTRLQRKT